MIRSFDISEHGLTEHIISPTTTDSAELARLVGSSWIDVVAPSRKEEEFVGDHFGDLLPPRATVGEIEHTSRYHEDATTIRLQLNFLGDAAEPSANTHAAIAWFGGPLVSMHATELVASQIFLQRAAAQPDVAQDGISVLLGLVEAQIDHIADMLEDTHVRLESLSHKVLDNRDLDLEVGLVALADIEHRNGRIRHNLMDAQRVLTSLSRSDKLSPGHPITGHLITGSGNGGHLNGGHERLANVLRDVDSLLAHTAFLLEQLGFLSNTIMGLINTEQNQIVKVLSVVAVVFLPPALIAGIYGMNFKHMPELSWAWSYPVALGVIVLAGVLPYVYAKRRRWL